MPQPLPPRPNLDHLRNEAKALLKSHRQGNRVVCETLRNIARLASLPDDSILTTSVSLQEAQHALANAYGFKGWKELRDEVAGASTRARQAQIAYETFASKGPPEDSTGSAWEQRIAATRRELLQGGEQGFDIVCEFADSPNGRVRSAAAIFFGLSDDPRAADELRDLLSDEAVAVRSRAVRFYAARIQPTCANGDVWGIDEPADTVPEGIDALLPLVHDASARVALQAFRALSAYAGLGNDGVTSALQQALAGTRHNVRHVAARALGVPCPGCGAAPLPNASH